jgi:hypothetical protein
MEVNLDDGMADIIYRYPNGIFVIELKYAKPHLGLTAEQVSDRLDRCVADAFGQIDVKQYTKPYFGNCMNIYAVAVVVHGYSDARIRFKKKVYRDGKIIDASPHENENHEND